MPSRLPAALLGLALAGFVAAAEPPVPRPQGYVTDLVHAVDPATATRITRLVEELKSKTGAEIAVVTVDTTAPLDDFSYAMKVADAWHPGRKGEDTGVVFLVAKNDRKVRILVGYGLEGILPDGLVGEIIDRDVVPAFRAGDFAGGIRRGVEEVASRIAASRGVELTGVPPPRRVPQGTPIPGWVILLVILVFAAVMLYQLASPSAAQRNRRGPRFFPPGGFGPGGFGGGFGGGGGGFGGFGGFGGGSFGGGGAGRSW
jgi:uncharacterized protein